MLHGLGAGATFSVVSENSQGYLPSHFAASGGHDQCLCVLHELGAERSLSDRISDGSTPAHLAASGGYSLCLSVLAELGAGASLSAIREYDGESPADCAANAGHLSCVSVLHSLGATLTLRHKSLLLHHKLESVVSGGDATSLSLVSSRASILEVSICRSSGSA